jgi:hypothetical protein
MEHRHTYGRLILMAALHFGAMYALMYAMVDTFDNLLPNRNQLFMAALMTAPMLLLEPLLMGPMYPNKGLNAALLLGAAALGVGSFMLIRQQTAITDAQVLRSMIPHHAGAILMCDEAALQDAEVRQLCERIVAGQEAEIDWMKDKLASLKEPR